MMQPTPVIEGARLASLVLCFVFLSTVAQHIVQLGLRRPSAAKTLAGSSGDDRPNRESVKQ